MPHPVTGHPTQTFTPQAQIERQSALGRQLTRQSQQPARSGLGVLGQGLTSLAGGLTRSAATQAETANQQLQQQALASALGGDLSGLGGSGQGRLALILQRQDAATKRETEATRVAAAESARRSDREFGLNQRKVDIAKQTADLQRQKLTPIELAQKKSDITIAATKKTLRSGGKQVLGAVDLLLRKVGSRAEGATQEQRDQAKLFEQTTGLLEGTDFGIFARSLNPAASAKGLALVKEIRQDSQAINTLMQRALLKGGGSITENEREQINQILGGIATTNSSEEAVRLLNNFKQLVRSIFDFNVGPAAAGQPADAGDTFLRPSNPVITQGQAIEGDIRGQPQLTVGQSATFGGNTIKRLK